MLALAVRWFCYALAIVLSIEAIAVIVISSIAVIEVEGVLAYFGVLVSLVVAGFLICTIYRTIRWAFDQPVKGD